MLTGHEPFRDFVAIFRHETHWADLAVGRDALIKHRAYSHVDALGSAAMAYAAIRQPP